MYDIKVDYQTEEDYSMLQISVAQYDTLKAGKSKLYGIMIVTPMDISFSLFALYGKVTGKVMTGEDRKIVWEFKKQGNFNISSSDPNFRLGMYYVKITAQEDSTFSLIVDQQLQPITLSEGQPYFGEIQHNNQIYFLYRLPQILESDRAGRIKLYVDVNFKQQISSATLYFYEYSKDDALKLNTNAFHSEQYDRAIDHLSYALDATKLKNDIAIGLKVQFEGYAGKGRYEIVAHTSGLVAMTPSLLYRDSLDGVGDTMTYELAITKPSVVYIEVTPCLGQVEFYVTSSLRETNDRKYDIKKSELSKGRLFGSFQGKAQTYYITVKGLATSKYNPIDGKSIWYTIRQRSKVELDPYATDSYYVESSGLISCSSSGGKVSLSWGNVLKKKDNSRMTKVRYSVYMGEEEKSNMETACGMKLTKAQRLATDLTEPRFVWKVPTNQKVKTVIFNVVAIIPEHEQVISYDPIIHTISKSSITGWLSKIWCKG
jgi:hypothetical protein